MKPPLVRCVVCETVRVLPDDWDGCYTLDSACPTCRKQSGTGVYATKPVGSPPAIERRVHLGAAIFSFHSFNNWVAKASSRYGGCGFSPVDLVALDAKGRICRYGAQFMRARDEDAFPVTVYHADPPAGST